MNTNFHYSPANLLALLQEARRRTDLPPEVPGRVEALCAYAQSGSVSDTCHRYGISRQTFYRWLHRFDARDLLSLADHPKFFAKPAPAPVAAVLSPAAAGMPVSRKAALLTASLAFNVLLAGIGIGLLLGRSLLPPATPASLIEQPPLPAARPEDPVGRGEGQGEGAMKSTATGSTVIPLSLPPPQL